MDASKAICFQQTDEITSLLIKTQSTSIHATTYNPETLIPDETLQSPIFANVKDNYVLFENKGESTSITLYKIDCQSHRLTYLQSGKTNNDYISPLVDTRMYLLFSNDVQITGHPNGGGKWIHNDNENEETISITANTISYIDITSGTPAFEITSTNELVDDYYSIIQENPI